MDLVTQRNAAQVEQAAAATTTMSRQAEDMMAMMDLFKVDLAPAYTSSTSSASAGDDEWQGF